MCSQVPAADAALLAECCAHHAVSTQRLRAAAAAVAPLAVPRPDLDAQPSYSWKLHKCTRKRDADIPHFVQDAFGDTTVSAHRTSVRPAHGSGG